MYPRKRWASNIKSDVASLSLLTTTTSSFVTSVVCQNASQSSTPTPVIVKFARLKLKGDIRFSATNVSQFTSGMVYAVFVPEGNSLNADLVANHPEYILGWTVLSMDSGNSFSLTSTLKRNLNSGDSIRLLWTIDTTTTPSQNITYNFYYTLQYWTTSA